MGRKNGELGKADWQSQVRQDFNFIKQMILAQHSLLCEQLEVLYKGKKKF